MIKGSIPFKLIYNSLMPQFDIFTFSSQIFWALLFFTLLYLSFAYYLVPSISATLKVRSRRLKLQENSSQTFLAVSSENTQLDVALIQCFIKPSLALSYPIDCSYKFLFKPLNFMAFNNSLWVSVINFTISNDFKNKRLFSFFEACLFRNSRV